jgi:2Fe-2S ferredoxin
MSTFKCITRSGREFDVEYNENDNIMVALYDHFKGEPWGDCGGCCICATCHVEIIKGYPNIPHEDEEDTLEGSFEKVDNSRLGCQCPLKGIKDKSLVVKVHHID